MLTVTDVFQLFFSCALSNVELALNIIPYLRFLLQKALSFPQFVQQVFLPSS